MIKIYTGFILSLFLVTGLSAETTVNPLFSDHMVLQRNQPVPVWGRATPGEEVTVAFADQTVKTIAAADGRWKAVLSPMEASADSRELVVSGSNTITVRDVLVGEVWLCAGQSNMEWVLPKSDGGAAAIAASANPLLRMCRVPHNVQMTPQSEVAVKWTVSGPAAAKWYSAIGYWFGSKLQKELGVPIGIIDNSFGGTTIESWMPAETLKNGPWPQDKYTSLALAKADYDRRAEEVRPVQEKYDADKAAALAAKLPPPSRPSSLLSEFKGAVALWNGELAPLLPFRIRGVAWYQGESNAYIGRADTYKDLLPALIKDWRAGFEQPDLPFLIFQIARNRKWQTDPNETSGIAELQETQLKTALATPHAALIVTTDMGGPDVHYTGKEPVAERATKAALALAYGRDVEYSGPIFKAAKFEGGRAVIYFSHTAGGLEAKDGALTGFVIAGRDKKFVFADARIEGDTVVVSSPEVPEPSFVRYGWADLPKVNLFNKEGLPASPFRTDNGPVF